jgi:hypothetical protein
MPKMNISEKPNLRAFLNPNPVLRGDILIDPHGRKYKMNNDPFLEVEMFNFPRGEYSVNLRIPFKLTQRIKVNSSCFSIYFLDPRFEDNTISKVRLEVVGERVKSEFEVPIRVHKLSGKVCNFDEKATIAYIWATRNIPVKNSMIVKTDQEGNYELYYPEGRRLRVFVGDTTYGRTTLESWIMADELKSDVEIDPHIGGNWELYEFRCWFFDGIWNLFFLPAIVSSKILPELNKRDLRVWINNIEGDIRKFTYHKVYYRGKKSGAYYPAYLACVIGDRYSNRLSWPVKIRAQIDSKRGRGEAWFIHYQI